MKKNYTITVLFLTILSHNFLFGQCDITLSDPMPCATMPVAFDVNSPSGTYGWDFDNDGAIDMSGSNVIYFFPENHTNENYSIVVYEDGNICNTLDLLVLGLPDPNIGVMPGSGILEDNLIRVCSGTPQITLEIYNASSSYTNNASYEINWGDGDVMTYNNSTFSNATILTHDYNAYGFYNLSVKTVSNNGCTKINSYTLYNGSNPSVGLANPGNTVGLCVPATIDFPITNTENNPTGTNYILYVSGEIVGVYSQENVPAIFSYTFLESSCGESTSTGNYENAFDVQILASNPCGSSQATIEPIELSDPPEILFVSGQPANGCVEEVYTFTNESEGSGEVIAGDCSSLLPSWSITPGIPGIDWVIISGNTFSSDEIEVKFLIPGSYNITMTLNSPSCGLFSYNEEVEIVETSIAGATGSLSTGASPAIYDECLPTLGTFTNLSTGENLSFDWNISPNDGWEFIDPYDDNSTDIQILFTEPGAYEVSLAASNFCSSDTWDTTLVIIGTPEVILTPIPNSCESATLNFDASNVGINSNSGTISSVDWNFPGGTPATSNESYPGNIYYDSPGTYNIDITVTNQCGTYTASQSFEIEATGTVMVGPDLVTCETTSAIVVSGTPEGGIWSGNDVTEAGLFTPSNDNIGDNLLVYTLSDGACLLDDSLVVIVTPAPIVNLPNEQLLCIDDAPYDLSAATPIGGAWTGSGINENSFDPAEAGIGIHSVTYTYYDQFSGCSNSETMHMTVVPLPEIILNDTSYCLTPGLVSLPVANPTGGNWSGVGVSGNLFDPMVAGGAGNYNALYTYIDNNSCMQSKEIIIVVGDPTAVDAGNDFELCSNSELIDLGQIASPPGGSWNANGSLGLNGSILNPELAGVGVHTLTYTLGQGNCQVTDDIIVTVNPIPQVNAMDDFEICVSENLVTLTATPDGGDWMATNGGLLVGNIFDASESGEGVFSHNYSYTDANGCQQIDELVIKVTGLPNISTTDTAYCNTPGAVALPLAQPAGGTWSGPGISNNLFYPTLAGGTGIYELIYSFEDDNNCQNSETAIITVLDAAHTYAGVDDTLCIDQGLFQLTGFSPAGGQWLGSGLIDPVNVMFDPAMAGPGLHQLTYSFGVGNCYVEDSKSIYVVDLLVEAGEDISSCFSYDAFMLEGYSPAGGLWSGDGITDAVNGIFDPAVANAGTHVLTYTYTDPITGCAKSDTREVTNYPMVPAAFAMPNFACRNDLIYFENLSSADYEMVWSFGFGAGSSTELNPVHSYNIAGTYIVTLIVTNQYGCKDTTSHPITIADVPIALFDPDLSETCSDIGITFSNQSFGDSLSYLWEFGNFMTSTDENPGTIFFEQGFYDTTYLVTLTVTNICGSASYQDIVLIHPSLEAGFGIAPLTECSPLFVDFANASAGTALEYFWDFGNGNTSNEQFPETEVYFTDTMASIYTVTLIATNVCGADTVTNEILVESANVIAAAESSTPTGCAPLTVEFYNFSSPSATIDWDFGDGNTSSLKEPSHTFTEAGEYIVIQYANSDCGYDSMALYISVYPQPEVQFEYSEISCSGQEIQFVNNSTNTSGNYWDFGDGETSSLNNPTHIYDSPGTYTITLTGVSFGEQCVSEYNSTITILEIPTSTFEPSTTYGCAPLEVTFENNTTGALFYHWDFGDGNTSIETNPSHIFAEADTYEVSLLATDANGCFEEMTIYNIIVTPIPVAVFEYEKEKGCGLPATIRFENLSQDALDFEWSFGEQIVSSLTDMTYTFTEAGTYQVSLFAYNQFACSDQYTMSINILENPVAEVELDGLEGCGSMEVAFNNASTYSTDYFWDFGDGHTSTSSSPTHEYANPGTYDIQLIASINDLCSDTITLSDLIKIYSSPFANFEALPIGEDGTYDITNLSLHADEYYWEFSDGTTSSVEHPEHRFTSNAIQQIYLEATNQFGCVDDTLISFIPEFVKGLFLPNAFSPEQGLGDVRLFKPKGIGLKEYQLQIYSTYGQLLWESTKLDEEGRPAEGWDGIVSNELMPQDVYVWKCSGIFLDGTTWSGEKKDNGEYKTIGSLVLLR